MSVGSIKILETTLISRNLGTHDIGDYLIKQGEKTQNKI
jgi:hypothetical protein